MPRLAKPVLSLADAVAMRMSQPERHVEAVAGGAAVEGADRRRVHVVQHDRRRVAQVELAGAARRRAEVAETAARGLGLGGEVEPGAERPPVAGEHDAADVGVAIGLEQEPGDRPEHRARDRVHPLRRVERDRGDVVGDLVADLVARRRRVGGWGCGGVGRGHGANVPAGVGATSTGRAGATTAVASTSHTVIAHSAVAPATWSADQQGRDVVEVLDVADRRLQQGDEDPRRQDALQHLAVGGVALQADAERRRRGRRRRSRACRGPGPRRRSARRSARRPRRRRAGRRR